MKLRIIIVWAILLLVASDAAGGNFTFAQKTANVREQLLSAENMRTNNVWNWFMKNDEIKTALRKVRLCSPLAYWTADSPMPLHL